MVSLTAPNESVDLFLRLEADPRTNPQIEGVLAAESKTVVCKRG
jgi:hypothetical protein